MHALVAVGMLRQRLGWMEAWAAQTVQSQPQLRIKTLSLKQKQKRETSQA